MKINADQHCERRLQLLASYCYSSSPRFFLMNSCERTRKMILVLSGVITILDRSTRHVPSSKTLHWYKQAKQQTSQFKDEDM